MWFSVQAKKIITMDIKNKQTKHNVLCEACVEVQASYRDGEKIDGWTVVENLYGEFAEVAPDTYYIRQIVGKKREGRKGIWSTTTISRGEAEGVCALSGTTSKCSRDQLCVYVTQ